MQQLLEAYPDAEPGINGYDGEIFAYGVEAGHVRLTFLVENDVITSISLGTYYEAPGWVDEAPAEEPAYSFASSDMIVYQKEEDGWLSYHMQGQAAKKLEVILGIEDLTPIDELPQAQLLYRLPERYGCDAGRRPAFRRGVYLRGFGSFPRRDERRRRPHAVSYPGADVWVPGGHR